MIYLQSIILQVQYLEMHAKYKHPSEPTPSEQIVAGKGNKARLAVLLEIARKKQRTVRKVVR